MKRRAFSLVELLMAMALFSTLLVMALGILHWALRGSQAQEANTRAAFLAQGKMEELFAADKPESADGVFPGQQGEFKWQSSVKALPGDFLELAVTITGPRGCSYRLSSQRRLSHRELFYSTSDQKLVQTSEDYRESRAMPGTVSGPLSLAPDGVTLAYVATHEGKSQIFTSQLNSKEPGVLLFEHPSGASEPAWCPTGKSLAFIAQENGVSQVFVFDLKSKLYENKSNSSHNDGSPSWTPDGKSLLFARDSSSIILKADGQETALIDDTSGWNTAPSLSPDSKQLVFMSNRDGNPEIYLRTLPGGKVLRLTEDPSYDTLPRFSPDAKRIVFLSDRQDHTNRLYTMNPDGSQVQVLTPRENVSQGLWLP